MDKIQTAIFSVLGLAGGLALLVPNSVPAPQNGQAENARVSNDAERETREDTEEESEDDSDLSGWADEEVPVFGESTGFGGDPTAGFDQDRVEDSEEVDEERSYQRSSVESNAGNQPEALTEAGLKNGSGGDISVSAEDLANARKI